MERQVRALGPVERISPEENEALYAVRTRNQRLALRGPPQSEPVEDRPAPDALPPPRGAP